MKYKTKEELREAFKKWLVENLNRKANDNLRKYPLYVMNCYVRDMVEEYKRTKQMIYTLPARESKTGQDLIFNWGEDEK